MYILAYFAGSDGAPETDLSPTMDAWNADSATKVLSSVAFSELGGGWYYYDFSTANPVYTYVYTVDGGATLVGALRYAVGGSNIASLSGDISSLATTLNNLSSDYTNQYYSMRDLNRKMLQARERKANEQGRDKGKNTL